MAKHLKRGQQAERLAARYLTDMGYLIGAFLVFVEVKSLQKTFHGNPEDSIGKHKKHMLFQAADAYQIDNNWHKEVRFDAISVNFYPQAIKIEHFEDAFS